MFLMSDSSSLDKHLQRDALLARVADLCTADTEAVGPCPAREVWEELLLHGDGLVAHKELMRHMARCSACRVLYAQLAAVQQGRESPQPQREHAAPQEGPARGPGYRWGLGFVAACACVVLAFVFWSRQDTPPHTVAFAQLQTLLQEAPRVRSASAALWEGGKALSVPAPVWRAYAAGEWQARADGGATTVFPPSWLPPEQQNPQAWAAEQPAAYGHGYAAQAVRTLCAGRGGLSSSAVVLLHELAVTLPAADVTPPLMTLLRDAEQACAPLLHAANEAEAHFGAALGLSPTR